MTDMERDQIDSEAQAIIRSCQQTINLFKHEGNTSFTLLNNTVVFREVAVSSDGDIIYCVVHGICVIHVCDFTIELYEHRHVQCIHVVSHLVGKFGKLSARP